MSSNDGNPNGGPSAAQPQQKPGSTSPGISGVLGNIVSRVSSTKRSKPMPQLTIERNQTAEQEDGDWEDIPEGTFLLFLDVVDDAV